MQLSDYFDSDKARAYPAPSKNVTIKLLGANAQSIERLIVDAKATLVPISEEHRLEALRLADDHIRAKYKGDPRSNRHDEEIYFLLARALRDPDDLSVAFAVTPLQLRNSLVLREALRLWDTYLAFVRDEFPDEVSPEEVQEIVKEAKAMPLLTMMAKRGVEPVRAAWSALILALDDMPAETSEPVNE